MDHEIRPRTNADDIAEYRRRLQAHDWSYQYSEDRLVWTAGNTERVELASMQARLDPTGAIWNEYAPKDYELRASIRGALT
jgi:hypothetical protein